MNLSGRIKGDNTSSTLYYFSTSKKVSVVAIYDHRNRSKSDNSGENKKEKSRCHFEKYINHEIITALDKKHETEGQPLTNHIKIFSLSGIELG